MQRLATTLALLVFGSTAARGDVVELVDGVKLAGELRKNHDEFTLRNALGTQTFDSSQVKSVELRNDLLPRYQATLTLAGNQPHALVSLAQWCLERGLYPEAFDCVDRAAVATKSAPDAAALKRLRNDALLEGTSVAQCNDLPPSAIGEKLLLRLASKSASRADFARAALGRAPSETLVPWLITELADVDSNVRRGAATLLGDVASEKGLAKLIRASLIDTDEKVRDAARTSALASGYSELAVPYIKAVATDDERLRLRAYPALQELRDPRVVPALIGALAARRGGGGGGAGSSLPRAHISIGEQRAFVQDFDVEIAQGAVIAKPVIGVLQSGVVLDVAVAGTQIISFVEQNTVIAALRKVTGQDLGKDASAWKKWWDAQDGRLPDPPLAAATKPTAGE